jgi:general secretion pathway protein A
MSGQAGRIGRGWGDDSKTSKKNNAKTLRDPAISFSCRAAGISGFPRGISGHPAFRKKSFRPFLIGYIMQSLFKVITVKNIECFAGPPEAAPEEIFRSGCGPVPSRDIYREPSMYSSFFGFREKPFTITPNPRFIFLSKNHKEAFAHLLYGIDTHAGFIELTGEVGTGKTTVLRALLNQLGSDTYRTALIFNPSLSAIELLQNINHEYGIPCDEQKNSFLLHSLNQFLLQQNAEGRTIVLVIDEAQNLDPQVLEQIRLISNLETEKEKLIQIVLVGQPELREKLKKPELRQLSQRITVRYHLCQMDFSDSAEYIEHRLEVAAGQRLEIFSPGALKRIFRYSGGLPRLINAICDRALLIAYTKGCREVSARMVDAAFSDVRKQEPRVLLSRLFRYAATAAVAILSVFGLYGIFGGLTASTETSTSSPVAVMNKLSLLQSEKSASADLHAQLARKTEGESAVAAFNAIARIWGVVPIPLEKASAESADLEKFADRRGLRLARNNGNLGALLRLDYPAILELTLHGGGGVRYVSLLGTESGGLIVSPPFQGRKTISSSELEKFWSGRSYLPWKNVLNLPLVSRRGDSGEPIQSLKQLLAKAGFYRGPFTDVFDEPMLASVKRFQAAQGIEADGIVGGRTLLLLYRTGGTVSAPRLAKKGE